MHDHVTLYYSLNADLWVLAVAELLKHSSPVLLRENKKGTVLRVVIWQEGLALYHSIV